jgi:hypothetical protein
MDPLLRLPRGSTVLPTQPILPLDGKEPPMKTAIWLRRASWLSALALIAAPAHFSRANDEPTQDATPPAEAAAPAEPPRPPRPPRTPRGPHSLGNLSTSKYVLRMHLAPLPKVLDQQLDLKGQGILVGHVEPDGPAAKAGIQEDDILLAVGEQSITNPADLMKAVDASEGKEMTLKVLRAGKTVSVSVTPEARTTGSSNIISRHSDEDLKELRDLERKIREKLEALGVDLRMQFIQPGRLLPEGADFMFERKIDFPDDLSVEIRKQGKEPAQIEVKQGDQSWTVVENDLDELPDEVRRHVEGLLGRGPMRMRLMGDMRHRGGPHGPDGPGFDGALPPGGPDAEFGPPPPGGPEGRPGPRARRPGGPPRSEGVDEHGPDGPPPPGGPEGRPGPRARRPGGPPRGDGAEGADGPGGPERGPRGRGGLERRLDELSHEFERMRSRIEALRDVLREGPEGDE